jgi:ABC-type transport system involved in multi-copper enzyme maturation permease subunit
MRALFVLTLRQMLGGKKILLLTGFLCLPILLLGLVLILGGFQIPEVDNFDAQSFFHSGFLYVVYPQVLCILSSLLYGASLLAGEIEDKTLTYLFSRSLARWQVLLGKYLATCSVLTVMTCLSMSLAFLLAGSPFGLKVWLALAICTSAACFAFTALFCLLGLFVPRRAIPVGILYAVVVEGILSSVPAMVNELTISFYLRSVAWRIADVPLPAEAGEVFRREAMPFIAGANVDTSLIRLAIITVFSLAASAIVIHRRQWPLTEGV